MERVPVYYEGVPCGTLEVETDGLYVRFFACVTVPDGAGLLRLIALGGAQRLDLGIPAPDGGVRTLRRSIPAKRCPRSFSHGELKEADGWQAYSGRVCGLQVTDGLRRGSQTAFLFRENTAGRWLCYLPELTTMERGGQLWLVRRGVRT